MGQGQTWIEFCPYQAPGECHGCGTTADGRFNVNVPDGTWSLNAQPGWDSIYSSPSPMKVIISNSVVTQVNDDTVADSTEPFITGRKIIVRLTDPSINGLKGVVYDPSGTTPQSNVQIGLRPAVSEEGGGCNGQGGSRWTQTDSNGQYGFGSVPEGLYEIEAIPIGGSQYSRVRLCYTITSDESTRTKNINLTAPSITGTVATPPGSVTSENPTPDIAVAYAWVDLHTEGQMGPGNWYGGNTNENGQFNLGGVVPGTYTLEVHPAWGSVYTMRSYSGITLSDTNGDGFADANLDALVGTASTRFPNKAIRVGVPNLKGQIVDPSGKPVNGVWVMVHDTNWQNVSGGDTDENGYFRIGGLANGTYQIEVNLPWGGAQAFVAPSGLSVEITDNIGVIKQNGSALPGNKITLTTPKKIITGSVKKEDGSAVANAKIEAHQDMGGGFFETETNAAGEYTLKVTGGSWWVAVRPSWGATQPDWVYNEPPKRITFASDETAETNTANFTVTSCNATVVGEVEKPDGTAVQYAWVDIRGSKGVGNGSQTDNNGRFRIKVPAGTYTVSVFAQLENYGSPSPKTITVAPGQKADAGTLYLVAKNAHIRGFVQDTSGNPVQNVIVTAWQFEGAGWSMAFTDQTGAYDLSVWGGTWGVMANPMSQNYIYVGRPKKIEVKANETSAGNNFELKIADKTLKVRVKKPDGSIATDAFGGVWVKDTSSTGGMLDFGGPMEDMMMHSGMMSGGGGPGGGPGGPMGPGMERGGFAGGELKNGYTEIKVPAGTYEVGLGMPPGSKYTLDSTKTITINSSDTCADGTLGCKEVDLLVKENSATISGHFYLDSNGNGTYDSGEEVADVRAFVHADRTAGGWQMTESNPDGSYSLKVCGGEWYVNGFIDPAMVFSGGSRYLVVNENKPITVKEGGSATKNFKLKKLDATIEGTVLNPDGTPMTGTGFGLVWVFTDFGSAATMDEFKGPGGPGLGTFTDANGNFSLKVPAGTYKIGAGLPPWDTRDLLTPDLITVTVASGETSTGHNLQFKTSNATISGNITLNGANKAGFVKAWSEAGRGTGTPSFDGSYTLKVTQGDVWYVQAISEISNTLYESPVYKVDTTSGGAAFTQNLALASRDVTIPEGVTATFDASVAKTIKLTKMVGGVPQDQVVLEIPAGAIKSSGTISVSITPTISASPDAKDKPIGILYDFVAKDSTGKEIKEFLQDVTITIYYDPALVTAAGYSEDSITPKYYNSDTGSWENYSNIVRDPDNHRFIIKTNHFSTGGLTGGAAIPAAPSNLTATASSSSQIDLSWTDNANNEEGFKIYRDGALVTTTAANVTSYSDTGLTASTTYSYYVKATNASGDSDASNTASATTSAVVTGGSGSFIPSLEQEQPQKEQPQKEQPQPKPPEKKAPQAPEVKPPVPPQPPQKPVKMTAEQIRIQMINTIEKLIELITQLIAQLQAQIAELQR